MRVPIVPIGNSKGNRLSKTLIEKYNIKDAVDLILDDEFLIIKPIINPRSKWEQAFKAMHDNSDDKLFIEDVFEDENFEL